MKIFIDSNVIIADYHLSSPYIDVLKGYIDRTEAKIFVPKIVVEEVKNKYEEHLRETKRKFTSNLEKIKYLTPEIGYDVPEIEVTEQKGIYSAKIDEILQSLGACILDTPDVTHEKITQRAIKRRKPFTESGKGYIDTLIWESILKEIGSDNNDEVVFVSDNYKDFGETAGIFVHEDLRRDLLEVGAREDLVTLYRSIKEFIDLVVKPQLETLDDIERQLEDGTYENLKLDELLEAKQEEIMEEINDELPVILSEEGYSEPYIDVLYNAHEIHSIDVYRNSETELFINYWADFEVAVEFFIDKWDYSVIDDEKVSVLDYDWNEWSVLAEKNILLTIELAIVFNISTNEVSSFEINSVDRIDITL